MSSKPLSAFARLLRPWPLLFVACGGGGDDAPAPTGGACGENPIVITDDTNYSMTSEFTVELSSLQDAADLVFDWSEITIDYFGKAVDAQNDIDHVVVSLWSLTPEELEESLRLDDLPLNSNVGAVTTYPDGTYTSMNLLGFDVFGNVLPEEELWPFFDTMNPDFMYPQDSHTYMVTAGSGTVAGKETHMMSLFHLDPASTETELRLTNDSASLDFMVDLDGARPIDVPKNTPGLVIKWREMTKNSLGNPYPWQQITKAVVAHFATDSLSDLEADFLNLEDIADGWWSAEVASGDSIELGSLLDDQSAPFPGIDGNGTWMVALFCTETCNNPAPWSITVLRACD